MKSSLIWTNFNISVAKRWQWRKILAPGSWHKENRDNAGRMRPVNDVLVHPAQPFGTACRIIPEFLLYLSMFSDTIYQPLLVNVWQQKI